MSGAAARLDLRLSKSYNRTREKLRNESGLSFSANIYIVARIPRRWTSEQVGFEEEVIFDARNALPLWLASTAETVNQNNCVVAGEWQRTGVEEA